ADGSLYIADSVNNRIRRVGPDGIITTVAGGREDFYFPVLDGVPATQAQLASPAGVAVGADGSLYIADTAGRRIRRVGAGGIINTVGGREGRCCYAGDGGLATQAQLVYPGAVAVGPDGSLYIAISDALFDNRILRLRSSLPGSFVGDISIAAE